MQPNGYGKFETSMEKLLPMGAWLVSGVEAIKDFERSGPGAEGFVQALDKETREKLWAVTVQSGDMENAPAWLQRFKVRSRRGAARATAGDAGHALPAGGARRTGPRAVIDDKACTPPEPGRRHRCRAKIAYSVRASGMRPPRSAGRPAPAPSAGSAA